MSDIGGPRKPLDLRPSARPAAPAQPAPAPRPVARAAAPRAAVAPLRPTSAPRPAARPQQAAPAVVVPAPLSKAVAKKSGGWKTVLQFVAGVFIIILVAFSIVVLYVKYYAG